jgi:hypothetical protein
MLPEGKADFKKLVDQYISLYEMSDEAASIADERRRVIQLLCRSSRPISVNLCAGTISLIRITRKRCTS